MTATRDTLARLRRASWAAAHRVTADGIQTAAGFAGWPELMASTRQADADLAGAYRDLLRQVADQVDDITPVGSPCECGCGRVEWRLHLHAAGRTSVLDAAAYPSREAATAAAVAAGLGAVRTNATNITLDGGITTTREWS